MLFLSRANGNVDVAGPECQSENRIPGRSFTYLLSGAHCFHARRGLVSSHFVLAVLDSDILGIVFLVSVGARNCNCLYRKISLKPLHARSLHLPPLRQEPLSQNLQTTIFASGFDLAAGDNRNALPLV